MYLSKTSQIRFRDISAISSMKFSSSQRRFYNTQKSTKSNDMNSIINAILETSQNHTEGGFNWHELFEFPKLDWWKYLIFSGIAFTCICFAGICSGLTLGLLSIDKMSLNILLEVGTDKEKKYAKRLKPIISRHHLLLVTLLLWNALAMETLPLFLDRMVPEFLAIVLSVTFVLLFGEIIPQSVISRFGLAIGGNLFWLVWLLIIIGFPIAFPISKLLDCILGHDHSTLYKKAELKELVDLHGEQEGGHLTNDEILVLRGALDLRDKRAETIMTAFNRVFMLNIDSKLDHQTIQEIMKHGHSRVPVYRDSKNNVIGLLLVKNLIHLSPADATSLTDVELKAITTVDQDIHAYDLLNHFQSTKSHMALVRKKPEQELSTENQLIGIVTLEDIFEELIGEEIVDETDVFVDVQKQIYVADMFRRISQQITRKVHSPLPEQERLVNPNIFNNV
jgi:metal transporter CNNM